MSSTKTESAIGSGIIDGNKAYTVAAFCRELGIARKGSAYNQLRRAGLQIRKSRYILGRDFLEILGTTDDDNGEEKPRPA